MNVHFNHERKRNNFLKKEILAREWVFIASEISNLTTIKIRKDKQILILKTKNSL